MGSHVTHIAAGKKYGINFFFSIWRKNFFFPFRHSLVCVTGNLIYILGFPKGKNFYQRFYASDLFSSSKNPGKFRGVSAGIFFFFLLYHKIFLFACKKAAIEILLFLIEVNWSRGLL
jgi:hypothetical protein